MERSSALLLGYHNCTRRWEQVRRALRSAAEGVITWRFHQERALDRLEIVIGALFFQTETPYCKA
jgi:hypothetical protein